MKWLDQFKCRCPQTASLSWGTAEKNPPVPFSSPAHALARSLTEPETRGEWERTAQPGVPYYIWSTAYRNESRDITVTRYNGMYSGPTLATPFTLSKAEQQVVSDALDAFDAHRKAVKEAETLARLNTPAKAMSAGTVETRSGSVPKGRQRGPKASPKGGQNP